MLRRAIKPLASLKLTVLLLSLSLVLVFVGTLAQARIGVWQAVETYFRSPIAWIDIGMFIPRRAADVTMRVPFPGGMTIGAILLANLLAAHLARFKATRKRLGIMILHSGLIVLLIGEFVTGLWAREGFMSIDEGKSARHVEDIRSIELAVIDPSAPDSDRVVVVPARRLLESARIGTPFADPALPFEIRVERWLPNARLLKLPEATFANRGVGLEAVAEELPRASGAEGADAPAAYLTLLREGRPLGTWLVSVNLVMAQRVEVDGATFGLALRYKRTYKPYVLELLEFRHDKFVGTDVARNFSSRVRIIDPARKTDREVLISMNSPLRYAGDTYYQASYKADGSGTVLQVVRNPGWLLPYIACILVGGGMALHFVLALTSFLRRRAKTSTALTSSQALAIITLRRRVMPWAAGLLGLLIATSGLYRPLPSSEFDVPAFARLPVSSGGRIKPMDTAARNLLMVAGGRQSVAATSGRLDASTFLLELIARPEHVRDLPVIRIDHPQVRSLLNLGIEGGARVSLAQVEPYWTAVAEQAGRAHQVPAGKRDPFQRNVASLYERVNSLLAHARMMSPYVIPPLAMGEEWRPFHDAFLESGLATHPQGEGELTDPGEVHPGVAYFISMMTAYSEGNAAGFNRAVRAYRDLLRERMPDVMRKVELEVFFNRASLFTGATVVYLLSFLLVCAGFLARLGGEHPRGRGIADTLRACALGTLCAAFLVHTVAIAARIHLQGRPPVTNLYSSAVFVGWASVLFGLMLERIFALGIALMGAASIGFATLIIAHNLGTDGDTMQMMQAVLDSNFWLATHVVTITLGYSATFLAGILAIVYLLGGVCTRAMSADRARALSKMIYGVVCFALLLSFVGTVLGGIWADQSWGRFWGWDPKENGAALVVIVNAIILHARWGGLVQKRGIAVLAVGGNIVTAWSWFGTNMLGVGLHSYGFMSSAAFWLVLFIVSQLCVMGVGLLPRHLWRSREG